MLGSITADNEVAEKGKSEFARFLNAYTALIDEFRKTDHPKLKKIADSLDTATSQMKKWLAQPKPPVKRSALVLGMEQGLREIPVLLAELPRDLRNAMQSKVRHIVESNIDGFFSKERELMKKIISRRKVRTEREWYLLRFRVDEIEGDPSHEAELIELYRLLDDYEKRA